VKKVKKNDKLLILSDNTIHVLCRAQRLHGIARYLFIRRLSIPAQGWDDGRAAHGIAFALYLRMTTAITIHPPASNPSPALAGKGKAPDTVNNDFLGSFADLLDIFNPLQHIPGVSTLYRELTGDTISAGAQIAGGVLFGGPIGLIASIANAVIEQETGKDVGANLFAAVTGKYETAKSLPA